MSEKRKSILIVNNNLQIGGIQKALQNLLHEIGGRYDIELFVFSKRGACSDLIPDNVRVTEAKGALRLLGMSQAESKQLGFFYIILRYFFALFCRIFGNGWLISRLVRHSRITKKYDFAIAYSQGAAQKAFYGGVNEFVLYSTNAAKKLTFVHCDFTKYPGNNPHNRKLYEYFDRILIVSYGCRKSFLNVMPHLSEKSFCVHNCLDTDNIRKLADIDTVIYDNDCVNIISVGRLGKEKGLLRCIPIMKRLKSEGFLFRWYIVGGGALYNSLEKMIKENELEDTVILCGMQNNPYRYMKNANMLFVPSYHEAAPMVFGEAECLDLPVLSTLTTSAVELVEERNIGIVCDNDDNSIFLAIRDLFANPSKLEGIKHSLRPPMTNTVAVEEFDAAVR